MKTKMVDGKKYNIKKELGMLFNMYANNYGIRITELEDEKILFQKIKLGQRVPGHYMIRDKSVLDELNDTPQHLQYEKLIEQNILLIPESF